MPLTEAEILRLVKSPETLVKAYEAIIENYQQRLYWHIRKMVISHDDADDVLQNTFIKIWKGLDKFRGDSKLYTWLYRIATNEAISFLQSENKRRAISMDNEGADWEYNFEGDVYFDGDEATQIFWKAIEKLPEKQKVVFKLKYFEEMKYEDMSGVLGTSIGALKASYHHAVNKIKEYLKEN